MGRPSSYTEEIADEICRRITCGETLTAICRHDGMPDRVTVYRWSEANDAFRNRLMRAREAAADAFADEALEVSRGASDSAEIQRANILSYNLRWAASVMKPRVYGTKVQNEHTGPGGGPIQTLTVDADQAARVAEEFLRAAKGT